MSDSPSGSLIAR